MNKSELAERLAVRTGMSKAAAKDAVDGVFETIGEAPGEWRRGTDPRLRHVRHPEPAGAHRAQPRHGRAGRDRGLDRTGLQGGQDAEGCRELSKYRMNRLWPWAGDTRSQ